MEAAKCLKDKPKIVAQDQILQPHQQSFLVVLPKCNNWLFLFL